MAQDERGEIFDCKCKGRNPECQHCGGNGYYYQNASFNEPKEKLARPPDPFPVILKESSQLGDCNSRLVKYLADYKNQLEKERKVREMYTGKKGRKRSRRGTIYSKNKYPPFSL